MSSLYEIVKNKMDMFEVDMPFAIKEIKTDNDGNLLDYAEERAMVKDDHVTFALSVEHSYQAINELVAKVKLANDYGSLMCSQRFSTNPDAKAISTFDKVVSPLINAYAFKEMMKYLPEHSKLKEKMEWKGYYESILGFEMLDAESIQMLISLYVPLKSAQVISEEIPTVLKPYKNNIEILLELAQEEPSPLYMSMAVNKIVGKRYYCALDQKEGEWVFLLRDVTIGDYMDQAIA